MSRVLIMSAVALGLVAAASGLAHAVPSVTAAATAGASGLDLDGEGSSGQHIVKVADLSASTTGENGFTVSISSGSLANTDSATSVPFQVTLVADGAAAPSAANFTIPSGNSYAWVTASSGSAARDLYILYTPAALQDPGAYSASVDLSIIDN